MMFFVFRPKRRVNGKVRVARTYVGQFRLVGDLRPTRVPLGVSDKQVAKESCVESFGKLSGSVKV
jgi:hypothetical protein